MDTADQQAEVIDPIGSSDCVTLDPADMTGAGDAMTFLNSPLLSNNSKEPLAIGPELANSLITASSNSLLINSYLRAEQAVRLVETSQVEVENASKRNSKGVCTRCRAYCVVCRQCITVLFSSTVEAPLTDLDGCSRTDFHRKHMMSVKLKKRRIRLNGSAPVFTWRVLQEFNNVLVL